MIRCFLQVDFGSHVPVEYSDDESPAGEAPGSAGLSNGPAEAVQKATLNVVHIAVEMAPIAKVGCSLDRPDSDMPFAFVHNVGECVACAPLSE